MLDNDKIAFANSLEPDQMPTRTKKLHGIYVNQGGVGMELNQNMQNQGEIDMDPDFLPNLTCNFKSFPS